MRGCRGIVFGVVFSLIILLLMAALITGLPVLIDTLGG